MFSFNDFIIFLHFALNIEYHSNIRNGIIGNQNNFNTGLFSGYKDACLKRFRLKMIIILQHQNRSVVYKML